MKEAICPYCMSVTYIYFLGTERICQCNRKGSCHRYFIIKVDKNFKIRTFKMEDNKNERIKKT